MVKKEQKYKTTREARSRESDKECRQNRKRPEPVDSQTLTVLPHSVLLSKEPSEIKYFPVAVASKKKKKKEKDD